MNGIYVLFEEGENGHGTDRVVRIGSHRGPNNLGPRLEEHFLKENKDRSIFRKNIGRALLNRDKDPFLSQWETDLTSKASRRDFASSIDESKLQETESAVTSYIRDHFLFSVVPCHVDWLEMESSLISIVSTCNECLPSDHWLGLHSPVARIRESGLWLVQGLNRSLPINWSISLVERGLSEA